MAFMIMLFGTVLFNILERKKEKEKKYINVNFAKSCENALNCHKAYFYYINFD